MFYKCTYDDSVAPGQVHQAGSSSLLAYGLYEAALKGKKETDLIGDTETKPPPQPRNLFLLSQPSTALRVHECYSLPKLS